MAARAGVEPTTRRLKVINLINEPLSPTTNVPPRPTFMTNTMKIRVMKIYMMKIYTMKINMMKIYIIKIYMMKIYMMNLTKKQQI